MATKMLVKTKPKTKQAVQAATKPFTQKAVAVATKKAVAVAAGCVAPKKQKKQKTPVLVHHAPVFDLEAAKLEARNDAKVRALREKVHKAYRKRLTTPLSTVSYEVVRFQRFVRTVDHTELMVSLTVLAQGSQHWVVFEQGYASVAPLTSTTHGPYANTSVAEHYLATVVRTLTDYVQTVDAKTYDVNLYPPHEACASSHVWQYEMQPENEHDKTPGWHPVDQAACRQLEAVWLSRSTSADGRLALGVREYHLGTSPYQVNLVSNTRRPLRRVPRSMSSTDSTPPADNVDGDTWGTTLWRGTSTFSDLTTHVWAPNRAVCLPEFTSTSSSEKVALGFCKPGGTIFEFRTNVTKLSVGPPPRSTLDTHEYTWWRTPVFIPKFQRP